MVVDFLQLSLLGVAENGGLLCVDVCPLRPEPSSKSNDLVLAQRMTGLGAPHASEAPLLDILATLGTIQVDSGDNGTNVQD